jgi:hypothetical protein
MNRGQFRRLLRGWLQDQVAAQWPDADGLFLGQQRTGLDTFINLGLKETQKIIVGVDPECLKCQYRRNLTVPTTGHDKLVPFPVGTWAVFEIRMSEDGGTSYSEPLDRITLDQARAGKTGFVHYDSNFFMLSPSPTVAYAWGLSITVMPTMVFALDTDELPIRFTAHETMILKQAQKLALMDVGEPVDKLEAEIAALETRVPRFYITATQPGFVVPIGYDDYELR